MLGHHRNLIPADLPSISFINQSDIHNYNTRHVSDLHIAPTNTKLAGNTSDQLFGTIWTPLSKIANNWLCLKHVWKSIYLVNPALKFKVAFMRQLYDLLRYFMLLRYLMFCPMLSCTLNWFWFDLIFFFGRSLFCLFFLLELNFPHLTHCCYQVIAMILFNAFHICTLCVLLRSDIILVFLLLLLKYISLFVFLWSHLYMYLLIYIDIFDFL